MRAWVREWACTPLQSPVEGPGRSVGPPDLRGRSLRATAPAGRLESRIVCKPHLLRLSRKRVSGPVTKKSARALGARGFEECRAPRNPRATFEPECRFAPARSNGTWPVLHSERLSGAPAPEVPAGRRRACCDLREGARTHYARRMRRCSAKRPEALGRAEVRTQRLTTAVPRPQAL